LIKILDVVIEEDEESEMEESSEGSHSE